MAENTNKIIGKAFDRADGQLKVTGKAEYTSAVDVSNAVHGVFALSTIANGAILKINTAPAEQVSGVIKIYTHLNAPRLQAVKSPPAGQSFLPLQTEKINYSGQPIALVIAETLEIAAYAADLIHAEYKKDIFEIDFTKVKSRAYIAENFAKPNSKVGTANFAALGKTKTDADAGNIKYLKRVYKTADRHHNPMESSSAIAEWRDGTLLLYNTTQGVTNSRQVVATALGLPPEKVRVVSKFLGGGFGCKGYVWAHEILAAMAAKDLNRPVKIALSRKLEKNGNILIECGTQEIGTGVYTVLPQIAAEALNVPVERVRLVLGDTLLPEAGMTAGSSTTMSAGSAVHTAAMNLRKKIRELANADYSSDNLSRLLTDKNLDKLSADGEWSPGKNLLGAPDASSMHTFGAIFAEVRIDRQLMIPRVARIVGVYSAGRIVNPKTAKSQMTGGMVWGIGQALTEHSVLERNFGCFLNKDLANYEVSVNADVPLLEASFIDEIDTEASAFGGKGVGELGAVGVSAAIANAFFHATGKRIRELPLTLDKLL